MAKPTARQAYLAELAHQCVDNMFESARDTGDYSRLESFVRSQLDGDMDVLLDDLRRWTREHSFGRFHYTVEELHEKG